MRSSTAWVSVIGEMVEKAYGLNDKKNLFEKFGTIENGLLILSDHRYYTCESDSIYNLVVKYKYINIGARPTQDSPTKTVSLRF